MAYLEKSHLEAVTKADRQPALGTSGYLSVFACALGLIMLAPPGRMLPAAALCMGAAALLYPASLLRLVQPRWLLALAALVVVNGLFNFQAEGAGRDWLAGWIPLSQSGLLVGLRMALRAATALVAVDGFSGSVSISEVTGLLERFGLRGLGFSVGIAMNLLPSLHRAGTNAGYTLWMRGGLRRRRLENFKLYLVSVLADTLRYAEDIALAAETRAFSPENAPRLPISRGKYDLPAWGMGLGAILILLFL